MAVKRRVIWLKDHEWAWLQQRAKDRGETVSVLIAAAVLARAGENPEPPPILSRISKGS